MIPHNQLLITESDQLAIAKVLSSGWIAQGKCVRVLEETFVKLYCGGAACAVSNGTAALFMALRALGAEPGSRVAVPTYSCSALLNAIFMAGALPVPIDVLPDTFCIDPASLEGLSPDFVVAVHTYGAPAGMNNIRTSKWKVIEDCCQSIGGFTDESSLGQQSDAAVFSFFATKIITGGQGGLVWARDYEVISEIRDYREFDCRKNYKPRFNFQMTDMQAALVNSQMYRLDQIKTRRQAIARRYHEAIPLGLASQKGLLHKGRMPYRFVVISPDLKTRDALRKHMREAGVSCIVPIESYELLHRYLNQDPEAFPIAERLANTTLSLPIHLALTDSEVDHIAKTLGQFS